MLELLGPDDYAAFLAALGEPPPVSIRLKASGRLSSADPEDAVPWHPLGRYLRKRPVFTLDPLFTRVRITSRRRRPCSCIKP